MFDIARPLSAVAVLVLAGCGTSGSGTPPSYSPYPTFSLDGASSGGTDAGADGSRAETSKGATSSGGGADAGATSGGGVDGGSSSGGGALDAGGASGGGATDVGDGSGRGSDVDGALDGGGVIDAGGPLDAGGPVDGSGSDDSGAGGAPDGVVTEWDAGPDPDLGNTGAWDTHTAKADVPGTGSDPNFAKDVAWGSAEDAMTHKPDIDYDKLGDTGTTATVPGLCTPKLAQYNIEEKKIGGKVDVIWWIDTSGSMKQESSWLSTNLNNFAGFLAAKGLDYRMVLVGKGNSYVKLNPNLGAFLAPGTFLWVKQPIYSTDGLRKLVNYHPKPYIDYFVTFLRPEATKNFVAVTDDNSTQMKAAHFESLLLSKWKKPDGSPMFQDYVWHSIVAYGPIKYRGCSTGARIGTEYLALTAKTKGVKGKVCDKDWKPHFEKIAKGVIQSAKPGCTYPVAFYKNETTTEGFDLTYIAQDDEVHITAAKNNTCPPSGDGFTYDGWPNPKKITLCPSSCDKLKGGGNLVFNHGCL